MLLVHLADLHLGHRAYRRVEGGRNTREGDVAGAFQRALEGIVSLRPQILLVAGDVFDRPDPPPGALVTLTRGLEALRAELPETPIFLVAGARDIPRVAPPELGALAALGPLPQVEVVGETAAAFHLPELDTHLVCLPDGALSRRPYPQIKPRPEARWNLLLAYADVGTGPGPGLPLELGPWDYAALGYQHQFRQVAPRAFYAGSLERVGPEPWREAGLEKGYVSFDLESAKWRFHRVGGRAVVVLAPLRLPRGGGIQLREKLQEVLAEVPGGVDGKLVRVRVEGLTPEEVRREGQAVLKPLLEQALHLAIEVDDFQGMAEEDALPLVGRDRGHALRVVRERLRSRGEEGLAALALLEDLEKGWNGSQGTKGGGGREEALLIRELHGSGLPLFGELSLETREGLVGWVGGDGRVLQAFEHLLLVGVGGRPPGGRRGLALPSGAQLVVRLGGAGGESFWIRNGGGRVVADRGQESVPPWGLPAEGLALAWCGIGGETLEALIDGSVAVLSWARGAEGLARVLEGLKAQFPALGTEGPPGPLTEADFERLRLEAELADLEAQLKALADAPQEVSALEGELREVRGEAAEVTGELEAATTAWLREQQDAETHLRAYRDRAREIRERIRTLESLGPDGPCPTCRRPLGETVGAVLEELRDEWDRLVQDGQWWRRRLEQLSQKPDDLRALETRSRRLNARLEDCTERLERARSRLRERDELRIRAQEVRERLQALRGGEGGGEGRSVEGGRAGGNHGNGGKAGRWGGRQEARILHEEVREVEGSLRREARGRLLRRGGRRLNRLSGGRILGFAVREEDGGVSLVEVGGAAGVEAEEDKAAAAVALRVALAELLAEDWSPLGSLVVGDPFDRMGEEDQVRALLLLRRLLSRIPQVWLLTRGSVVNRAPEYFDALFEFREDPFRGVSALRSVPAGVGVLRIR